MSFHKTNQLDNLTSDEVASIIDATSPISPSQHRLWMLQLLDPDSNTYHIPVILNLYGELNWKDLEESLREIVSRHEILRSVFFSLDEDHFPHLLPLDSDNFFLERPSSAENIQLWTEEFVKRPFKLINEPGFRCAFYEKTKDQYVLAILFHHIIIDGWSLGLFFSELSSIYAAKRKGLGLELHEAPQYSEFANWENQTIENLKNKGSIEFWGRLLEKEISHTNLCGNFPQPLGLSETTYGDLDSKLKTKLNMFCEQRGLSPFTVLLSAVHALIYRTTRTERSVVGTTTFNRKQSEFEKTIGFFVNTLALPADFTEDINFDQLVHQTTQILQSTSMHDSIPFDQIVAASKNSSKPLFRVAVEMQQTPYGHLKLSGLKVDVQQPARRQAKFDLTFFFFEGDQKLSLQVEYDSNAYSASQIESLRSVFVSQLNSALSNPKEALLRLPLEANEAVDTLRGPTCDIEQTSLWESFESVALKRGPITALCDQDSELSFSELRKLSLRIASGLQQNGVKAGDHIGIMSDREVAPIAAILALWALGAAYVPLDPIAPDARLEFMVRDANISCVLTTHEPQKKFLNLSCPTLSLQTLMKSSLPIGLPSRSGSNDVAYLIYTSGSTGQPKGCQIRTQGVKNLKKSLENTLCVSEKEAPRRISLNAPLTFDASVQQIVLLLIGHTLCIVPLEFRTDAEKLLEWLIDQRVDLFDCTPSHLKFLLEHGDLNQTKLRQVLVGGEAIHSRLWTQLANSDEIEFYNVYGPTECTVDSTIYRIDRSTPHPTLGSPTYNTEFYAVDETGSLLPREVPGELVIRSPQVADGYLNHTELTLARFIPSDKQGGLASYRTGDMVRLRRDGTAQFLGRVDDQVKIRGHRIELQEIRNVLLIHPGVQDAAVFAESNFQNELELHAYIQQKNSHLLTIDNLRLHFKSRLPESFIPTWFHSVETMLINSNGKLDHSRLRSSSKLFDRANGNLREYSPPTDLFESRMQIIWQSLLGQDSIGIENNFFHLGGQSLLAARLIHRVRQQFGTQLTSAEFFQNPTIREMAMICKKRNPISRLASHLIMLSGGEPHRAPLYCFHPMGGDIFVYGQLVANTDGLTPIFAIQSRALDDPSLEYSNSKNMTEAYAQEIFGHLGTKRECMLMGWSMGGLLAMEVAARLEDRGINVLSVELWDCGVRENILPLPSELDWLRGYSSVLNSLASSIGHELTVDDRTEIKEGLKEVPGAALAAWLLNWTKKKWNLNLEVDASYVARLAELSARHAMLFYNFTQPTLSASIHAVWADHSLQNKLLHKTNWKSCTRGRYTEQIIADATHYTLMRKPFVSRLTQNLFDRMALNNLKTGSSF